MKIVQIELEDNNEDPQEEDETDKMGGINNSGINTSVNGADSEVSNKSKKKKKGDEEDEFGPRFRVIIEKAEPAGVKISKKNNCIVEVRDGQIDEVLEEEQINLINYYVNQKQKMGWKDQFIQACMLSPQVDDEDMVVSQPDFNEAMTHFVTMFWKILFAFIPPVQWGGGWPAFFVALAFIGSVTAIVAEVATVLGCTVGLKEAVTAITLVAIGTSLPDTFASMTAAKTSEFADSAIGNVTGSNSVNVFVGLGIPWIISARWWDNHTDGKKNYPTPEGNLAFSVMLFLITSMVCFVVLLTRRAVFGGELGGPKNSRNASCVFLIFLWLTYVFFSTLRAYKIV